MSAGLSPAGSGRPTTPASRAGPDVNHVEPAAEYSPRQNLEPWSFPGTVGCVPATTPHENRIARHSVLHCDLDSFFASVEQALRPELHGKPVAVSAARGQFVITAASYEAKRKGVRVGVPLRDARRLCPDLAFVAARMEAYQRAGSYVHDLIRTTGARIETLGIDECFFNLRDVVPERLGLQAPDADADHHDYAVAVATWIRAAVRRQTGLAITVGIGSNKTVAKLASDTGKPDGLKVVAAADELEFLRSQPLGDINGIGPRTLQKLRSSGLETVGDLASLSEVSLRALLGKRQGTVVHAIVHNRWVEPVTPNPKPKTTSSTRTFPGDGVPAREALGELLVEVLDRLSASGRSARLVAVFAADGSHAFQDRHDLRAATSDVRELAAVARVMIAKVPDGFRTNYCGVTLDGLTDTEQLRLELPVAWHDDADLLAPLDTRVPDPADRLARAAFKGMPVHHPDFGDGVVEYFDGDGLLIRFADRERSLAFWAPLQF
jgi:DNA polymerase-4